MTLVTQTFTILIAEDDEDDYLLTLEALKEAGVNNEIRWVKDGEELLDSLKASSNGGNGSGFPGMILLDLNMPKKDGREVLEELKTNRNYRRIPVIVMTTSSAETDIALSYELGVNSFIQKPVHFQELVKVFQTLSHYWFETVKLPQTTH